jgi:hypothetical protein
VVRDQSHWITRHGYVLASIVVVIRLCVLRCMFCLFFFWGRGGVGGGEGGLEPERPLVWAYRTRAVAGKEAPAASAQARPRASGIRLAFPKYLLSLCTHHRHLAKPPGVKARC